VQRGVRRERWAGRTAGEVDERDVLRDERRVAERRFRGERGEEGHEGHVQAPNNPNLATRN